MHFTTNNLIKKSLHGFFLLVVTLLPISLGFTLETTSDTTEPELRLALTENHAYAQVQVGRPFPPAALTPEAKKARAEADAKLKANSGGIASSIAEDIGQWVGNAILGLASAVTWFGGKLLEFVTNSLVFGMGDWIAKGKTLGDTIDHTWEIFRDLCNLIFIFGFIYTGINTILNPESAETKRFVAKIIIAALLINFSLFFVKIIIDFSNFAVYQIYISMVEGSGSLSAKIADTLGIITIYDSPSPEALANSTKSGGFWYFVMSALFLLTAAFVFIGAAFLLISRFATLVYIMVASPILFAATIFPQTEEYASKLWHKLISAAFFAPAYFLLTVISLRLLNGIELRTVGQGGSLSEALDPLQTGAVGAGSFEIIVFFVLAIFFLLSSLTIAHSMGIRGSEMVIKKTKGAIGAATLGLGAKALRATAGERLNRLAESDGLKDAAAQKGIGGWSARQLLKGSRIAADSSFDARKVAGIGNTIGIGEGRKGGYVSALKEVKEKEEKFAKSLDEVDDTDVNVMQRKAEKEHYEKELRALQVDLRTEPDPAKKKLINEDIAHKKHEIHEAQVKYEQEKMRRQTGSTFGTTPATETALKAHEKQLRDSEHDEKHAWETFMATQSALNAKINDPATTTPMKALLQAQMDNEAQIHRATMKTLMDNTKAAKKAHEKFISENMGGYASVLENSSYVASWLEGRSASQNREAGKAVRKARKKGKPHDSGDHGGGHGGGGGHAGGGGGGAAHGGGAHGGGGHAGGGGGGGGHAHP